MNIRSYVTPIFAVLLWTISTQSLALSGSCNTLEINPLTANTSCNEEFENIANNLQPGDQLILHGGIYILSYRRAITVIGTPDKPITIRAAQDEATKPGCNHVNCIAPITSSKTTTFITSGRPAMPQISSYYAIN